jgi:hypothetical protein
MPLPFGAGNRGLDRRTGMGQPVCVRERDRMPGWGGGRWGEETSAEGVLGWSGPHPGNANGVEAGKGWTRDEDNPGFDAETGSNRNAVVAIPRSFRQTTSPLRL